MPNRKCACRVVGVFFVKQLLFENDFAYMQCYRLTTLWRLLFSHLAGYRILNFILNVFLLL